MHSLSVYNIDNLVRDALYYANLCLCIVQYMQVCALESTMQLLCVYEDVLVLGISCIHCIMQTLKISTPLVVSLPENKCYKQSRPLLFRGDYVQKGRCM